MIYLAIVATVGIVAYIQFGTPKVVVTKPESTTMAETIASSGVVQGHVETTVGAESQGILTKVLVEEGDFVRQGQLLAQVQDNIVDQQVQQAKSQLATAQALLVQASMRPEPSEIASAVAKVSQAEAGVQQQAAAVKKADLGRVLAQSNVRQAEVGVRKAENALLQAASQLDLAQKTLDRKTALTKAGASPQSDLDSAQTSFDIAKQGLDSAKDSLASAKLTLDSARDSVRSSEQDYQASRSLASATKSQLDAAISDLRTLRSKPRPVDVSVAVRRVHEAEDALATATTQAGNSNIYAPFAGTITSIVAQPGANPGATGVVKLVQTENLEIRLDLDEANLKSVKVGQRAMVTAPNGSSTEVEGHVTRIGSQIDSQRGTLEVYLKLDKAASWLRPGQTLNVNVVIVEKAQRILVPVSAVQRAGDQTVVFAVKDGHTVQIPVQLGLVSGTKIVVLSGLKGDEILVMNASMTKNGQRVKASK